MRSLPVFIKNKTLKVMITLGIIIPLVVIIILSIRHTTTNNPITQIIFIPFSISLILFPFTGVLRDSIKKLPQKFIYYLLRRPSLLVKCFIKGDKYEHIPEEPNQNLDNFFSGINYSIQTMLEYLALSIGFIFLIAIILTVFVKT